MERYFKISESELLELIAADLELHAFQHSVFGDRYDIYAFNDCFKRMAETAGLTCTENTTFDDIATVYLSDYPETSYSDCM